MFLRDANPRKMRVLARIFAHSPAKGGGPCPFAKITPFKTFFGFFIIPGGNLYKK